MLSVLRCSTQWKTKLKFIRLSPLLKLYRYQRNHHRLRAQSLFQKIVLSQSFLRLFRLIKLSSLNTFSTTPYRLFNSSGRPGHSSCFMNKVKDDLRRIQPPTDRDFYLGFEHKIVLTKLNRAIRICFDLSDLTNEVISDSYFILTIDLLSGFFAEARYLSKMKIKSGFLKMLLNLSVRHFRAIIIPFRLFK